MSSTKDIAAPKRCFIPLGNESICQQDTVIRN